MNETNKTESFWNETRILFLFDVLPMSKWTVSTTINIVSMANNEPGDDEYEYKGQNEQ